MNTKLHDIEHLLVASELRYRRLFETAKDGILILDAISGKIIDANPFMSQMLGYKFEYFIGKELWEIGLFKDKFTSQEAYLELKDKHYIRFEDMPLLTSSKQKIEVEFVCNIYGENGQSVAQCNIRDITARKLLEEKNRIQAEMLLDASRRKDEFLSLLAHELRNPLAPLSGALHLLRLPDITKETELEVCDIMERQINQLVRLVDDLLDMARINTQTIVLRIERVAIQDIIKGAIETSKPSLDSAKHTLNVSMPKEPIWLEADSIRIIQVINNILNNAAKFTPQYGQIDLSAECKGKDVIIRIKDNGIGIDADMLPYIFDMFTKVDSSITRAHDGLGIGLAIVRNIVELHGGSVTASSKGLGCGSEFAIWLPLSQKSNNPQEKE